jgi:hypothetical protein
MTIPMPRKTSTQEGTMASILLDCICETCGRQITMDELLSDFHQEHKFSPIELAALQAMRSYLRCCDPTLSDFEFPHTEKAVDRKRA